MMSSETNNPMDEIIMPQGADTHTHDHPNPSLNGFSQIPAEVLTVILLKAVEPQSTFTPTSWRHHVRISSVCRLWRDLTIQTPAFWSCMPFHSVSHIEEMLDLSKTHPLSVRIDGGVNDSAYRTSYFLNNHRYYPLPEHVPVILDARRLEEFHFSANCDYLSDAVFLRTCIRQLPAKDAPLLRSLRVECFGTPVFLAIPQVLFAAEKPRLRHVQLTNVGLDWEGSHWQSIEGPYRIRNLLTLKLGSTLGTPPPAAFLLDVLASSPDLESLVIRDALAPEFLSEVRQEKRSILLPKLRLCEIRASLQDSVALLLIIGLPKECRLLLETKDPEHIAVDDAETGHGSLVTKLMEICHISESTQDSGTRQFQKLCLAASRHKFTIVELKQHEEDKESTIRLALPSPVFLVVREVLCVRGLRSLELDMCNEIRTLSTDAQYRLPEADQWRTFFKRHASIKKLCLTSCEMAEFIPTLGAAPTTQSSDQISSFLLPQLHHLQFSYPRLAGEEVEELFLEMILARSRNKFSLETLTLSNCRAFSKKTKSALVKALPMWKTTIYWA